MTIQIKRFQWLQRASAWEQAEAWRKQRVRMSERFLADSTVAASAFFSAAYSQITGTVQITAQTASKRVQAELAAKIDKLA
ncbi:MAG TPA: hypothetical protein VIH40_05715 [Xanthobacteraceae bacterium]